MGCFGLILLLAAFIGVVIGHVRIAIYAYKEQEPIWGLICLLIPCATLIWGVVFWQDKESRVLFLRYLGCVGLFVLAQLIVRATATVG